MVVVEKWSVPWRSALLAGLTTLQTISLHFVHRKRVTGSGSFEFGSPFEFFNRGCIHMRAKALA